MKVWVTSDTHFNHDRIVELSHRPFSDITEMNEHIISKWVERVGPQDIVYVLGDFAYPYKHHGHVTFEELAARLPGTKHLIIGNHDRETMKGGEGVKVRDHWMWGSTQEYLEFKYGKSRWVFCHYPFETWRNAHHGWYMLHGHCHGTLRRVIPHRLDVGVDAFPEYDYGPIALDDIRDIMESQEDYDPVDHHGD